MVKASIQATTLEEYYAKLVAAQEAAHGVGYCSHHYAIRQAAKDDGCASYAELGVNQGATLACALLAGFKRVVGVDVALDPWKPFQGLFWAFADASGQRLSLAQQDSREPLRHHYPVDFMLLDTVHEAAHLREELRVHGPNVRRQILVHDTASVPALHVEAVGWGLRNGWTVQQRSLCSVGWTLLFRQA